MRSIERNLWVLGALLGICASGPAGAQAIYKCAGARSVTYSQQPCSRRVVNADDAPVPVKPNPRGVDVHRLEQNRLLARSLRQRPGESAADFAVRRHRARMLETDRDECARIDTRMPVEKASMNNPDPEEVRKAESALAESKKRFRELRC